MESARANFRGVHSKHLRLTRHSLCKPKASQASCYHLRRACSPLSPSTTLARSPSRVEDEREL